MSNNLTRRKAFTRLAGAVAAAALPSSAASVARGLCGSTASAFGFDSYCFTDDQGKTHQIYVTDGGGPPVILLHELPGLTDDDLATARKLAAQKYTVICPLLFGIAGQNDDSYQHYREVCGPKQFDCGKPVVQNPPHVAWLRQLCGKVRETWNEGKGIGVIGMCLTGAYPLALMSEPSVVAPVLCQPTIPVNPGTRFGVFTDKRALGLDKSVIDQAKAEAEKRDLMLLGLRYKDDWHSPKPRFERLVDDFGMRFYRLDMVGKHSILDVTGSNYPHSTLGHNFCDEAFQEVLAFFNARLRSTPDAGRSFPLKSKAGSKAEVLSGQCPDPNHHAG